MAVVSEAPGPGNYESKSTNESPHFSLKGREAYKPRDESPGPGQYEPSSGVYLTPSYRVGSAPRVGILTNSTVPGPGTYGYYNTIGETSKWSFGNVKRSGIKDNLVPGPGSYPVKAPRDPKAFSLGARRNISSSMSKDNPGPGNYSPVKRYPSPQFSISRSARQGMGQANGIPGPGTYKQGDTKTPGVM